MHDRWQNLLANAASTETVEVLPAYANILRELRSLEAQMMEPGIHLTQVTPTSCGWA